MRGANHQLSHHLTIERKSCIKKVLNWTLYKPIALCCKLTIPVCEETNWNKAICSVQPTVCYLTFLIFTNEIFKFSWQNSVMMAISVLMCVIVHFTTSKSEAPPRSIFWLWEISAFLMSLTWIYMLANVIVDILTTFEMISGISTALLGLTLLSWGNSVGDAFATIAISKRGFGEMAFTGCIAGPVFNVMFGIGISTMLVNLKIEGGIPFNISKNNA